MTFRHLHLLVLMSSMSQAMAADGLEVLNNDERGIADRLRQYGAKVGIGKPYYLGNSPSFGPDSILAVAITRGKVDEQFFELLGRCQFLIRAEIDDVPISDGCAMLLSRCSQIKHLSIRNTSMSSGAFRNVCKNLKRIETLNAGSLPLDRDALSSIKSRNLIHLYLSGTPVTDEVIIEVGDAGSYLLHVARTRIGDRGVKTIVDSHPRLVELSLASTSITDESIKSLLSIRETLEWLDIRNTNITDSVAADITELKRLEGLYLDGTKISDQTVTQLRKELPKCVISAHEQNTR